MMELPKEILANGGLAYAYRRYGDPQAPAIVLLMGLGMSMEAWPQVLISSLLAEGFQVITPDNRDSGASSRWTSWQPDRCAALKAIAQTLLRRPVEAEYALEDMALDLERLLDALDIRRAHIAGMSMGGMIAQVFAFQRPNRAATLTSISSAVGNPRTGLGRLRAIAAVLSRAGGSDEADVRAYFKRVLTALSGWKYRPSAADIDEAVKKAPQMALDSDGATRQLIALLASGNRSRQVSQIRVPTLVIHGMDDPLLPFAAGEETARLIPGAKLIPIEGLGHSLPAMLMGRYASWIAAHCHAHPA